MKFKTCCAALILMINLALTLAASEKTVDVEVRSGDTLNAFASKYLKDPSSWPKIYKINKKTITDPNNIFPGQIIKIPVKMLKDKIGDISVLKKDVRVKKRKGSDWKKGKVNQRLFPEDGIRTGKQSYAEMTFLTGGKIKVEQNSLLYLKTGKNRNPVTSLLQGTVNVTETRVITPSAEIMPGRDSLYDVDVDPSKITKVSVRKGEVDVKAQGKIVTVASGYRTMVAPDKVPENPVMLPMGADEAMELLKDTDVNIKFKLQISKTREFLIMSKDEIVGELDQITLRKALNPGQYYWRAAVLDKDGFTGKYSESRAIYISADTQTALELNSFMIMNKEEGIIRIKGRCENASRIIINGYPGQLDKKGNFTTTIILPKGQSIITATAIGSEGVVLRKYIKTSDGNWVPGN